MENTRLGRVFFIVGGTIGIIGGSLGIWNALKTEPAGQLVADLRIAPMAFPPRVNVTAPPDYKLPTRYVTVDVRNEGNRTLTGVVLTFPGIDEVVIPARQDLNRDAQHRIVVPNLSPQESIEIRGWTMSYQPDDFIASRVALVHDVGMGKVTLYSQRPPATRSWAATAAVMTMLGVIMVLSVLSFIVEVKNTYKMNKLGLLKGQTPKI